MMARRFHMSMKTRTIAVISFVLLFTSYGCNNETNIASPTTNQALLPLNQNAASEPCTPDENTVGLWHFDECQGTTVSDASANGNDGFLENGASWDLNGRFDCSSSCDGLDDRIRIPHHPDYNFGLTGDFTVELWFASQDNSVTTVIQHADNPSPYTGWTVDIAGDSITFKIEDSGGLQSRMACFVSDYLNGNWHHLAIVRADQGTTLKIYLHSGDGTRADSCVVEGVAPRNVDVNRPIYIAAHQWSGQFPWEVRIDEVRISNVARSPSEFCGVRRVIEADLDIKPGSCPNPLNPKSKGVLPAAILGSSRFDVRDIDVSSLLLEGVTPIGSSIEDVSTPIAENDECACTSEGPDGFEDLTLKFKTQDIVEALGSVFRDDVRVLTITGNLLDGTPFEASDCVVVVGRRGEVFIKL